MARSSYNDQIFINCPFDNEYLELYRASIFVILDAGFIPRCSREESNATQFRLETIVKIIKECRYGIHDLSRVELDKENNYPRFNMPFELGVFYGSKHFGDENQKKKSCLILEKEKFRYQKYISDISGIDVTPHNNTTRELIIGVRNWIHTASRRTSIPNGDQINRRFGLFQTEIKEACMRNDVDYDSMPFLEIVNNMTDWLRKNQATYTPLFG